MSPHRNGTMQLRKKTYVASFPAARGQTDEVWAHGRQPEGDKGLLPRQWPARFGLPNCTRGTDKSEMVRRPGDNLRRRIGGLRDPERRPRSRGKARFGDWVWRSTVAWGERSAPFQEPLGHRAHRS